MLPRRFDHARPFVTLGIIALVWVMLPLAVKTFTRASFFAIQAPLLVTDSYVEDLRTFWATKLHTKEEMWQAGKQVAGLIAQYEVSSQNYKVLEAELLRLENLLRLPAMPAYRYEPARIALRDFSGWWSRIIIRKGENYGIPVGAPVIFAGGVVGKVVEVHRYTSVVELVTSQTFRLAATVAGDTKPMSYQGGLNNAFSSPRGFVEFVPLDITASKAVPQRLVTSGLGGVFPPGLVIGDITNLEMGADGLFKTGEVTLDERLDSLTEVTVLVPLEPDQL